MIDKARNVQTYILTWHQQKYPWKRLRETFRSSTEEPDWSFNPRNVQRGDRIVLLMQSKGDKGVIGVGTATGDSYSKDDWDRQRAKPDVGYAAIEDFELLDIKAQKPMEVLDVSGFPKIVRKSGTRLDSEVADKVLKRWLSTPKSWSPAEEVRIGRKRKNHLARLQSVTALLRRPQAEQFRLLALQRLHGRLKFSQ